ncbi:MAG: NADP-dependent oxidoreductase [Candidatus Dormibacteria bacterium]
MTPTTMRAARFHEYGPPEVLVVDEVPVPRPAEGQVLVRVHAAGVNPIDWKIRRGLLKDFMPLRLPHTPGADLSGTVEQLGPGVSGFDISEAVYGRGEETYAEYALAGAGTLAPKPRSLSFVEAASVPIGSGTAWATLVDAAHVEAGQTVLVHGAAGGVGMYVVQLARWKELHVIGTASSANIDFVRSLGAETVIDYSASSFEEIAHDVDAVIDTVGGDVQERSLAVIKPGGIFVTIAGSANEDAARKRGVRAVSISAEFSRERLEVIASLIDSGAVTTQVQAAFPLPEAPRAHALSETGHGRGRIVLELPGP